MAGAVEFTDELVAVDAPGLPAGYFDRFMVNLHAPDGAGPAAIVGFGRYPGRGVADGYVGVLHRGQQRNLRFSTEAPSDIGGAGPLRYEIIEPHTAWRLSLAANPTGLSGELRWTARAPAWTSTVEVTNASDELTRFDHLVQSGRFEGDLNLDGETLDIDGWFGQRDRSRGVRTMTGGQGLHMWFQAQFPDRTIGFLLVEDRTGGVLMLDGAVASEAGELDPVIAVAHELDVDGGLDLRAGHVVVTTMSGQVYPIDVDAGGRGMYMAGLGYGGWHGVPHGRDHLEHDTFALDGSVTSRGLTAPLTDRFARLRLGPVTGSGVVEFAFSRSASYAYRPRTARLPRP